MRARLAALPICASLRRLRSDRRGVVALEFALVAPLFFALVFSSLEAGWTMTQAALLDRAVDITVREIRIGGSTAPATEAQIREAICDRAGVIARCRSAALIEMVTVEKPSDFPTASATCIDRSVSIRPVTTFQAAMRAKLTYIRVCIAVDPLTPLLGVGLNLEKDSSGAYRLVASSAFLNEPGT